MAFIHTHWGQRLHSRSQCTEGLAHSAVLRRPGVSGLEQCSAEASPGSQLHGVTGRGGGGGGG